jgi:hypothetical protein
MPRSLVIALLSFLVFSLLACSAQPASPSIATEPASADAVLPLPTFTPAPSPMPGGLYVDAGQSLGQISPVFFGTNWGPWLGVPPTMLDVIPSMGIKIVRFPGGRWGDENTPTATQIDMLMAFCEQWGAEPFINVRLVASTPAAAAEMVRYVNIEKGYKVRYWGIGNEPDLFPTQVGMRLPNYTPEQFAQDWRLFAQAMKAADPSIQLVGPEVSQFIANPTEEYGQKYSDWLVAFLKTNADLVDIVSVHRYPFPQSMTAGAPLKEHLRANSAEWDVLIPSLRSIVREQTGKDLRVAVTEFNSSWVENAGGEGTIDSHFHGIWFADVVGRMINQDTFMLQQFAVTGRYGMMNRSELNSTGLAFQMFTRHFGNQRVYASSDQQYVSVYAAKRLDGALTIMVINLNSEPKSVNLQIENFNGAQAEVWKLDLQHRAEQVTAQQLTFINTLSLSPESVTLFILPGRE